MAKHTVLVIEDSPDLRENLSEILSLAGYDVISADNGKKGVELAKAHQPDLILCDIIMPELDGFGVLYTLSKDYRTASIPFIFMSAKSEKADIRRAMLLGADDYITKPFEESELFQTIEARLRKTSLLQQKFERGVNGYEMFVRDARQFLGLQMLSEKGAIQPYKRKGIIFREKQYPHYIYLVHKGKVKTYKVNEQGKEYITKIYVPDDFFGYLPMFENRPYTETAEALEGSEIYQIPKSDFTQLLNGNWTIAMRFIQLLSNDIIENEQRMIDLAYNSVRKRVAQALLFVKEKYKDLSAQPHIAIGREDLASIAGTSIESAVRALSDFKTEGLIDITNKDIALLNVARLEAIRS